jgi:Sec-independent protein translocase protein TatA
MFGSIGMPEVLVVAAIFVILFGLYRLYLKK